MKLLVLSDLHSNCSIIEEVQEKIKYEEISVLIICGDLTHYGNLAEAEAILRDFTKLGIPVLFVPGNCDPKELTTMQAVCGATNVHGRFKEVGCLNFLGIGGSPIGPFNSPFEMSENEIERILNRVYEEANFNSQFILVSHAPPMNTRMDVLWSGIHAGSHAIRKFIESEKPSLVLCGHIHEARGKDSINGSLIVNPGPAHRGLYAMVDIGAEITVDLDASQQKRLKVNR